MLEETGKGRRRWKERLGVKVLGKGSIPFSRLYLLFFTRFIPCGLFPLPSPPPPSQPMSKQRREEVGAELLASLESLRSALESSVAPNMKAVEQYGAVREREREVVEEFEEARRAERKATQAFMEVQQQR